MRNVTVLFTNFKRALGNCPDIKIIDEKSQFDPPSESRKKSGLAELRDEGFDIDAWLGSVITLSKGNSITYHVIRNRQNKGEGSFNLNNPQEFLIEPEPWVAKLATNEMDRERLKKVRIIDQPSVNQTFTGLIVDGQSPPKIPSELVYFRRGKLLPMKLSFFDYYETLAEFMGILNWQLLFTDVDPAHPDLKSDFSQLSASLEDFKEIFPSRDFGVWEKMLLERQLV
ncbi:MAG: hypothetical protein IPN95_10205 [Bacteroidetes bacterium]|nr:hypothetical protein [Bacteroidota bacterium]